MKTLDFDIEALPVKISYVGETVRDDKWKCDQWRITLENKLGAWNTDYFTGLGLRNKADAWGKRTPKKPKIADVMYSLFSDARATDLNFSDWCMEYGYSDDSINALNTYRQCLDIATRLRKYLSPDQRKHIETIISDM